MRVFLTWILLSVAFSPTVVAAGGQAAEPQENPATGAWEAPTGHRQPVISDLPDDVQQSEGAISEREKELDRKLNICREC